MPEDLEAYKTDALDAFIQDKIACVVVADLDADTTSQDIQIARLLGILDARDCVAFLALVGVQDADQIPVEMPGKAEPPELEALGARLEQLFSQTLAAGKDLHRETEEKGDMLILGENAGPEHLRDARKKIFPGEPPAAADSSSLVEEEEEDEDEEDE